MAYTWVQEIVFNMSNGAKITGHIMNTDGQPDFDAESFLTDSQRWKQKIGNTAKHTSPDSAFEEIVKAVINYISKESCNCVSIDSPCNAKFIDKNGQVAVLTKNGITIAPTINGV